MAHLIRSQPVQPAPTSPPAGPAVLQPNPVLPGAESQDGKVLFDDRAPKGG